jgi:hypothetical protein
MVRDSSDSDMGRGPANAAAAAAFAKPLSIAKAVDGAAAITAAAPLVVTVWAADAAAPAVAADVGAIEIGSLEEDEEEDAASDSSFNLLVVTVFAGTRTVRFRFAGIGHHSEKNGDAKYSDAQVAIESPFFSQMRQRLIN